MRRVTVKLKPLVRVEMAIRTVWARPEGLPRLVLVHGEPGLGKSTAVDRAAISHGGHYLCASPVWAQRDFLNALAITLQIRTKRSDRGAEVYAAIITRMREIDRESMPVIVIDEFDTLSRKKWITETLRAIYDATDIPFVLVGMTEIERDLNAAPQFPQRIGQRVKFDGIDLEDAEKLATECCEVSLTDDLLRQIWTQNSGNVRMLLNAMAALEEQALLHGLESVGIDDLSDLQ